MKRITHDDKKELGIRHKIMWISQLNFCFQPIFDKDVPITTQVIHLSILSLKDYYHIKFFLC